jgi:hypothetical protein
MRSAVTNSLDRCAITWVRPDLGDNNNDHVIVPEERLRIATSRQWPDHGQAPRESNERTGSTTAALAYARSAGLAA